MDINEIEICEDSEDDMSGWDEWWCQWYICKKCGEDNITWNFNYCPDCGVKIKWIKKQI